MIFFARLSAGLLDRPLLRSALVRSALIAKTTNRKTVERVEVGPEHGRVIVVEIAAVCVVNTAHRSTPKEGVVAEMVVVAVAVEASGKGRETSCVVGTWIVAHGTSECTAIPSCSGG